MKNLLSGLIVLSTLALFSCGPAPKTEEESCSKDHCTEADLNAPVKAGSPDSDLPTDPGLGTPYEFPEFSTAWELPRASYEKMKNYYEQNIESIRNPRYVTIIDMRQHSGKKRFYLFDLATGKVERHVTSHGKNSDPDADGFATKFSNTNNSLQTSLGFYLTLSTYQGSNGYSLRLNGLSSSNSNAQERAIVVHPADYVSDKNNRAGRSWGCPALDPSISESVIKKIRSGSLMLIDY